MCAIEPSEFLTARQLMARYGVSLMWLERHIKDHGFPHPIKFGGRVSAVRHWRRSAVLEWEQAWEQRSRDDLTNQQNSRAARTGQAAACINHRPVAPRRGN